MTRPLVIIGAGGHAVSVAGVAHAAGFQVAHFVDASRAGTDLLGVPIIADLDSLDLRRIELSVAIGDNAVRERVSTALIERHRDARFPALIHPTAVIGWTAQLGDGTVLMAGAVVGAHTRIGRFCVLNTRSSIDHDSLMADCSSLAPGAVTGGTVHIGRRSAVSIGAIVKHGISIDEDTILGAGSYLDRNLPAGTVAWGTPARIMRSRQAGDPYLN